MYTTSGSNETSGSCQTANEQALPGLSVVHGEPHGGTTEKWRGITPRNTGSGPQLLCKYI